MGSSKNRRRSWIDPGYFDSDRGYLQLRPEDGRGCYRYFLNCLAGLYQPRSDQRGHRFRALQVVAWGDDLVLPRFFMSQPQITRYLRLSLSNGLHFNQIGSDQGLLAAPAERNDLALAAAERADLVLDFSSLAGQRLTVINQSQPLMEFRVAATKVIVPSTLPFKAAPSPSAAFSLSPRLRIIERIPESAAVRTRRLTLNEYMHPKTRVMLMLLDGKYWHDPVTETPVLDTVEIWDLINLTPDLHPIHLHLVRFQLLDRRAFDVDDFLNYNKFHYTGEPASPEPWESGWKDTIQAHPETVTRIIIPFEGYPGRYVWHCHLLEHAANEMMRPFDVLPTNHE